MIPPIVPGSQRLLPAILALGIVSLALPAFAQSTSRSISGRSAGSGNPLELWYREPANAWIKALPVGNGRLGAMIYGQPENERLQLTDVEGVSFTREIFSSAPDQALVERFYRVVVK